MKRLFRVLLLVLILILGVLGLLSGQKSLQISGVVLAAISVRTAVKFPQIFSSIDLGDYLIGCEKKKGFKGNSRQGIAISFNWLIGTVRVVNVDRPESRYILSIESVTIRPDFELHSMNTLGLVNAMRKAHKSLPEVS